MKILNACLGRHVPPISHLVIFSRGLVKQQVYRPPLPIDYLRVRVAEAIALVDGPMLQRV